MIKPFLAGIAVVVLSAAAFQLSPVDVEQNSRLSTIEAYLWSTPTNEYLPYMSMTPTFAGGTNTPTRSASPTRPAPSSTYVPTSSAPTSTTVSLVTPTPTLAPLFTRTSSPTALPDTVYAGNVSGKSLWVRECPALSCEILAKIQPGEIITVNPNVTAIADGYEWVSLANNSPIATGGFVAFRQISPPVRHLRW